MIPAFAHPCLVVPDLEKAREFYQAMFGFEAISDEPKEASPGNGGAYGAEIPAHRSCMMKGHNCFLELVECGEFAGGNGAPHIHDVHDPGMRRLSFYVDDCWAGYKRLLALGGVTMGIPVGDSRQGYSVYCRDPFQTNWGRIRTWLRIRPQLVCVSGPRCLVYPAPIYFIPAPIFLTVQK